MPTNTKTISFFGEPRVLPGGKFYRHTGVDQRAWVGFPVKSVSDGTITYVGELPVAGKLVIIEHGGGISSRYFHLSEHKRGVGDKVLRGEVIAESGNTGRTTGPHLHWELSWQGTPLDPLYFLTKMAPLCDQV